MCCQWTEKGIVRKNIWIYLKTKFNFLLLINLVNKLNTRVVKFVSTNLPSKSSTNFPCFKFWLLLLFSLKSKVEMLKVTTLFDFILLMAFLLTGKIQSLILFYCLFEQFLHYIIYFFHFLQVHHSFIHDDFYSLMFLMPFFFSYFVIRSSNNRQRWFFWSKST